MIDQTSKGTTHLSRNDLRTKIAANFPNVTKHRAIHEPNAQGILTRTFDVMSPRHCGVNEKEIEMLMGG